MGGRLGGRALMAASVALLPVVLAACGGDKADGSGTGGSGTGGGGTGGNGACSEATLEGCEYGSLGLSFTVRQGITVTEPETGRELAILARIPDGPGPFPAVVWSHGGGFNATGEQSSDSWSEEMASQGYVVIHLAHAPIDAQSGLAACAVAAVPMAECVPGEEDANGLVALVKTLDVTAVLDALPMLSAGSVQMGGPAIDLDRVAVAGWSAGARAPLITMGAVFLPSASAPPFSLPHPLPVAALGLSPIGPGYGGFFDDGTDSTWDDVRGPFFVGTGDNDLKTTKPDLTGANRRIAFDKQPADGTRWMLYSHLPGGVGAHGTYNLEMLGDPDERIDRLSRALRSGALAFLDANVKGDAAAQAWLDSDNAKVLAGDAEWVHH